MKKVIITGATSFIGVELVKGLLEQKIEVIAVIRPNSTNKSKLPNHDNLKLIELEMSEYDRLPEFVDSSDCLFHLSWDGTRGAKRNDKELQNRNYLNSLQTLEAAKKLNVKTFISAGSQAEYGNYNKEIFESTFCVPVTEYGKAKLKFFESARLFCSESDIFFKEPRFFSLYGPGDYENTLIMDMISKMLKNQPIDLTLGIQKWDFLYISDAIKGLIGLATIPCEDGVYNFGTGEVRLLKDFIEETKEIIKSESVLNYGAISYPPTGMVSIWPNVEKLKTLLNWLPQVSFEEGIMKIIASRKNNENN
ncbi:MAG: NAD(P)-dependent oxidoreductase [Streptococcaceae bacterium]|jgi:nucleoside-diphosphate-sugar epimerase|nr:NAD(P)-dependent oxidoreductase [Streptococcaceae bacterium]